MKQYDIFISHSSKDKKIADAMCHFLESKSIKCWIAPRDVGPGMDYTAEIVQGIKNSHVFVLIFSEMSNQSDDVNIELSLAFNNKLMIIPFKIEDVLMNDNMAYFLSTKHWIDAFPNPDESFGKLYYQLQRVILETQNIKTVLKKENVIIKPQRQNDNALRKKTRLKPSRNKYRIFAYLTIVIILIGYTGLHWFNSLEVRSEKVSEKVKVIDSSKTAQVVSIEKKDDSQNKKKGRLISLKRTPNKNSKKISESLKRNNNILEKKHIGSNEKKKQVSRLDIISGIERNMVKMRGRSIEWEIKNGSFVDLDGNLKPIINKKSVDDFIISKFELTQKEWEIIMGYNPSLFKGDKKPVENVTRSEVMSFIDLINRISGRNYRLPTILEWELATYGKFWGRESDEDQELGKQKFISTKNIWFNSNSLNTTHEVGQKKMNENGLYDLLGNVWEMIDEQDDEFDLCAVGGAYDSYIGEIFSIKEKYTKETVTLENDTIDKAIREKNMFSVSFDFLGSSIKNYKNKNLGFRLARD